MFFLPIKFNFLSFTFTRSKALQYVTSYNIYIFLAEEVLIVHDTGYIYKFIWSFDQEDILFYKPFKASYTPGFPVGTLVRKGN